MNVIVFFWIFWVESFVEYIMNYISFCVVWVNIKFVVDFLECIYI